MKLKLTCRCAAVVALLVGAGCSTNDEQVAGGQSGTDADGGMHCDLHFTEPSGDSTPLAQMLRSGATPNDYYDKIEGSHDFSCADGVRLSVVIERGSEARTTLGLMGSPGTPSELCPALQLDATVHVEASDGSLVLDSTFLTGRLDEGTAYTDYIVGGAVDVDGNDIWLRFSTDYSGPNEGRITSVSSLTKWRFSCTLPPDLSGEGGHGNEPEQSPAGAPGAP